MRLNSNLFALGLAACLLAAGCTVGPNYQRPPVTAPEQVRGQVGPAEAASLADRPWWELFQDPEDQVVMALAENEGAFGLPSAKPDEILNWIVSGFAADDLVSYGFDAAEVEIVRKRLDGTHWKRRMPTVAMISPTAIGESYLRPVDY